MTTYGYDALNRVIETVDANRNVTRYTYDAADRVTTVTDAMGNQRAYTYNAGGKITAIRDFDGNTAELSIIHLEKWKHTQTKRDSRYISLMTKCGTSVRSQRRIMESRNIFMTVTIIL